MLMKRDGVWKKILLKILGIYDLLIISTMVIVALKTVKSIGQVFLAFLFLPVFFFFTQEIRKQNFKFRKILIIYGLILGVVVTLANLIAIRHWSDLWLNIVLIPLPIYFILIIKTKKKETNEIEEIVEEQEVGQIDDRRRKFLKVLTSTGLATVLLYFLNAKKAQAAFFGSVPGPGTISIKDSEGKKIDPAVNSPTDGYTVSNVDDDTFPNYYGFINKDSNWYIQMAGSDGTFLFANNSNNTVDSYSDAWTGRTTLTYNSFDVAF
jgi:hypothetical protein